MANTVDPVQDLWRSVLATLTTDDRITPQLHGFLSLVEPKGILAGTFYLEVPNDFTRGMLEQRIRIPLLGRSPRSTTPRSRTSPSPSIPTSRPTPSRQQPERVGAGPLHRGPVRAGAGSRHRRPASATTPG